MHMTSAYAQNFQHHHGYSALRQVLGTQLLHSSLFSTFLFIFSKEPSFSSSSIPILGLPLGLLPTILPSITSLNSPSPHKICPIQFLFAAQSSPLIFDFLLRSKAPSRLSSYHPSSLS